MDRFTAYRGSGERVYRLYHHAERPDLRSDYEAQRPPTRPRLMNAAIHMGLSAYLTEHQAREKNESFDGKLGDRILVLRLDGELGVWFAETFAPGHVTVWGRPGDLLLCISGQIPV